MKRVIVLGGRGKFGSTAVDELRALGVEALVASRHGGADLRIDAEDAASIRSGLAAGDIVIDTAGPFQSRTTTLVEAALEVGFDVIDINDNLAHGERILGLESRIAASGIRVLPSCSSVAAISAAIVTLAGSRCPVRLSAFLAPASRATANRGSALSLIRSVGAPVRVRRNGNLVTLAGWSEGRSFPMPEPVGTVHGRLFESADALFLPRIWPSLQDVAMYVDTNTRGLGALLWVAARVPLLRRIIEWQIDLGVRLSRSLGSTAGGLGYEVEDGNGDVMRYAILSSTAGNVVPVAPAVLAAARIHAGRFEPTRLVPPDRHVAPDELLAFLRGRGVEIVPVD